MQSFELHRSIAGQSIRAARLLALVLAVAVFASACSASVGSGEESSTEESSTKESSPDDAASFVAAFEVADCVEVTAEELVEPLSFADGPLECGYVTVPADWSEPAGSTIQLATYRIPSTSSSPAPDPVVYLEGGPGGAAILHTGRFISGDNSYLRERGDVIIMDQRGTGYSIPALYCQEVPEDNEEEGHQACHDRFVAEGVDFNDYNSVNNALDVNAVREALGYEEWNLYGVSYGTRLALTSMRDTPEGVRSVVLNSVFPVQVNGMSESSYPMYWAIDQIAANCVTDTDCDADAKALIEDGIERLSASPVGDYDAASYVEALAGSIAEPQLMSLIAVVATGTDDEITELVAAMAAGDDEDNGLPPIADAPANLYPVVAEISVGMGYSVVCAEEAPYLDITAGPVLGDGFRDSTRAVIENTPEPYSSSLCSIWDVDPSGDIETQPVTSEVPTLILAGTADFATPPAWSKLAGDTLANSTYLEFPGLGHGLAGENDCLSASTTAFLNNPMDDLDSSCVDNFPTVDYEG